MGAPIEVSGGLPADMEHDQQEDPAGHSETARQIRGGSLLLSGRMISLLSNLVIQVLLVRALTTAEFGVFAYALSIVTMIATIITFALDRGLSRFIAIYRENGQIDKAWGTVAMQVATIVGLGTLIAVAVIGLRGWIGDTVVDDDQLAALLAIMVLVAPLKALDGMVASIFAAFGESKAIFLRRYVIDPILRLSIIGLLLASNAGLMAVGVGYVVAGVFGLAVYLRLLVKMLVKHQMVGAGATRSERRISYPIREVTSFTVPLLMSDAMFIVLGTSDVVILGHVAGAAAVAAYRAVLPLARLNQLVMNSFTMLYGPLMARLWARGDKEGLKHAYWETAGWVAVASFPIFAATFGLAQPLTVALFGSRYEDSASYLQILSAGFYFNAMLGFNGVTLKMLGRVWLVALIAFASLVVNLGANLLLIPRYEALGAAIGTALSVAFYNVGKQWGLWYGTGIALFDRAYAGLYATIVAASAVLLLASQVFALPLVGLIAVVGATVLSVLAVGRRVLNVGATFPEIRRVPLVGNWLAATRTT